jgi:hypothetical protein
MALINTNVLPTASDTRSNDLGGFAKSGGIAATLDQYVTFADGTQQIFKWIGVGTGGGSVIVEGVDGNPIYIPALPAGAWRPVVGRRILSAKTINGIPVTTTATLVTVYGGE